MFSATLHTEPTPSSPVRAPEDASWALADRIALQSIQVGLPGRLSSGAWALKPGKRTLKGLQLMLCGNRGLKGEDFERRCVEHQVEGSRSP